MRSSNVGLQSALGQICGSQLADNEDSLNMYSYFKKFNMMQNPPLFLIMRNARVQ